MKQLFIFTATILACMGMRAQETGIDSVLRQIEANNKELQANAQLISSQKLESRTENNLPDPTLSYAHLWDSKNSDETVGEMVVSQSFDFPTLYITRGKMNRLKTGALDAQAATMRQQILLQAKGMLLISHYNHLQQEEGYGVYDSVIRGSLDRLNPILMTALSSALALIPLALSGDLPGNEIQSPMAKVILGGLLTSTFLNGFIIPIVYLMMHGKKEEMHP